MSKQVEVDQRFLGLFVGKLLDLCCMYLYICVWFELLFIFVLGIISCAFFCVCGGGCVGGRVCVVVVCDGFLMFSLQFGWVLHPGWYFVLFWVG